MQEKTNLKSHSEQSGESSHMGRILLKEMEITTKCLPALKQSIAISIYKTGDFVNHSLKVNASSAKCD